MKYNNDFKFDLALGQVYEEKLGNLLNQKVEVKRDYKCLETGNIYVEYESRGKKSGISTTQAGYWCYWLSEHHCIFVKTEVLKQMCRKYIGTERDRRGGDSNTSKGIKLPMQDFLKII